MEAHEPAAGIQVINIIVAGADVSGTSNRKGKTSGSLESLKSGICETQSYFQSLFSMPDADLYGWSPPHAYPSGVELFRQNEPATQIYFIESGIVKLSHIRPSGKEMIVGLRRRDWLLGVTQACVDEPYSATATTLTRCIMRYISTKEFMDRVTNDIALSVALNRMLSREIRGSIERITTLGSMSAAERLKHFLRELVAEEDMDKLRNEGRLDLPLRNDELAEIVAVTPQHLHRILKDPELTGHIKQSRKILTILDPFAFMNGEDSEGRLVT
ncbi:MAG TPA: Crp/Fnr family transcriptional regulator [Thermodesulfovibrionales bacterium]|nr:Crp/Fnr family transcriptional regulator [Thermodesulfovibrionales bacterium]